MKKKIISIVAVIVFCIGLFSLNSIIHKKYDAKLQKNVSLAKQNNKRKTSDKNNTAGEVSKSEAATKANSEVKTNTSSANEVKTQTASSSTNNNVATPQKSKTETTPQTTPATTKTSEPSPTQQVNFTIVDDVHNATILSTHGNFSGDSVGSITMKLLDAKGIKYRATGSGNSIYFSSINGVKERDAGPTSGWMYYVNGEKLNVGCGQYIPKQGDNIVWKYVKDGLSE